MATCLIAALEMPEVNQWQFGMFKTVAALGGAAFSISLTGFVSIKLNMPNKSRIMAGGAAAVFVILYFFSPPGFSRSSPSTPSPIISLGNTGVAVAKTCQQTIALINPALDEYLEGQRLQAGFRGIPSPDDPHYTVKESIKQIQSRLDERATLLDQLGRTYEEFVALSASNNRAQIKAELDGILAATMGVAASAGSSPPHSSASYPSSEDGGLILFASTLRKRAAKKASNEIAAKVKVIADLFQREYPMFIDLQEVMLNSQKQTAISLWKQGMANPDPVLREEIGSLGLTYSPGHSSEACATFTGDRKATCQAQFETAIESAITDRVNKADDLRLKMGQSCQTALKELIRLHGEFEADEALDLTAINRELTFMQEALNKVGHP